MKLEFDTTGAGDVISCLVPSLSVNMKCQAIENLATVDDCKGEPPTIHFMWGASMKMVCVMKSVNTTYTKFHPLGWPIRATMTVSLLEVEDPELYTVALNMPIGTIISTAGAACLTQVVPDPENWREAAEENNIDNPRQLPPGTTVVI